MYAQKDTSFILYQGGYMQAGACAATAKLTNDNCTNKIEWAAKDDASVSYTVQRKLSSATTFTSLITVRSNSPELKLNNYNFLDTIKTSVTDKVEYRVLMSVQNDTTIVFYDTVYTHHSSCFAKDGFFFTPNPVRTTVTAVLNTKTSGTVKIVLFNIAGAKVYEYKGSKGAGFQSVNIPASKLSSGVYIGTIWLGNEKVATQKIVR